LSSEGIDGKASADDVTGGDRKVDKSFGNGGTGGTAPSSTGSPLTARNATRSFTSKTEWTLMSLLALFRLPLDDEWRPEAADMDVTLVAADINAESRELGVLV
jgi:hypothetical protein